METKDLKNITMTTVGNIVQSSVRMVRAECPIHGPYTAMQCILLDGKPYAGRCPKCMLEEERRENEKAKQAYEAEQAQVQEINANEPILRLQQAGVSEEDLHCTFASFDTMGDQDVLGVVNAFRNLCNTDVYNITCIGQTGRGKTHLAVAAMHQIAYNDPEGKISMRYIRESRMLRDMKASFSNPELKSEQQIIDELSKVDVLVIDEIGKAPTSAYNASALEEIMDARYMSKRTIILGNVSEQELKDHLTDGTISRLSQYQRSDKRLLATVQDYRRRKTV